MINKTYRRFAVQLKFHVDACQPRHPQGKGRAVTDARLKDQSRRLRCPLTGIPIADAWDQKRKLLTPLPETLSFLGRTVHWTVR